MEGIIRIFLNKALVAFMCLHLNQAHVLLRNILMCMLDNLTSPERSARHSCEGGTHHQGGSNAAFQCFLQATLKGLRRVSGCPGPASPGNPNDLGVTSIETP
ncbi:hypothetical protein E2C01_005816 [Portunus trituberculatus]|uniref:Uncharacterized protein n=1 Tax=Portunus trituberculatus TaxID=210409 RepID=A0A5B7CVD5_PORTR|nr:hypothetical protein [Portunus trituberculatus]